VYAALNATHSLHTTRPGGAKVLKRALRQAKKNTKVKSGTKSGIMRSIESVQLCPDAYSIMPDPHFHPSVSFTKRSNDRRFVSIGCSAAIFLAISHVPTKGGS
jgi:hypothetical protein